ncbi:hypothetical protein chiPu_0001784 [Chiloscyllium punctatum]|uniref:Amino acid transporter n=1 Tax=Chiloscyllium punctatum TaxID=137246 RepID=A0A401RZ51_CHIPU|nr:hypothetical protein [Chiloscyllium punctatum]
MAGAFAAVSIQIKGVFKRNGLLILSVLSVIIGCSLGFFLRTRHLSEQEIKYFQFPGELLMRMLKMLILPLVVSSLMSGLAALDAKASSRLGLITIAYYLWTTFVAVVIGIIMVSIIHPGGAAQKESIDDSGKPIMSSADALLDLIRNMFPSNLVQATFQQYRTKIVPIVVSVKVAGSEAATRMPLIYGIQGDNDSEVVQNISLDITPPPEIIYKSGPGSSEGMNVLGIVIFSATMGIMLGRMGKNGLPLVSFCQCLNESVMKIVAVATCYFPLGIVFLIAGKILEMDDPTAIGKKLGFYAITVVCGLVVHGLFVLPMVYLFITKKNPIVYIRGILQALLIALATSSSITATAASIGAAGIPQAGLVTMVIVLTSVGLPTDDITLIIAVDWALFRTMINVLGDALAAGIMAHICRKNFTQENDEVPLIGETKPISINPIMAYQRNGCTNDANKSNKQIYAITPDGSHNVQIELGLGTKKDHCTIEIDELETKV